LGCCRRRAALHPLLSTVTQKYQNMKRRTPRVLPSGRTPRVLPSGRISPLSCANRTTIRLKIVKRGKQAFRRKAKARKIYPCRHFALRRKLAKSALSRLSLRFPKSDRLPGSALIMLGSGVAAFLQFGSVLHALAIAGVALLAAGAIGLVFMTWLQSRAARVNTAVIFIALLFLGWLGVIWRNLGALARRAAGRPSSK
jgi:hypothetical protein